MIDIALDKFKGYLTNSEDYIKSDLTESDTRSKLLDVLFKEVLGWKERDINREGYVKVGYFDYELSTSNFRFIIEAKKNFQEFQLPEKGQKFKLKTLVKGNKEVLDQIREYILNRNLTYGVVSNGHQFIIGRFVNTDGSDWEQNEAFVFKSLKHIEENFIQFYNLLSRESIQKNGRIRFLLDDISGARIVESISAKNRSEELIRNDYSTFFLPIINRVFKEIYEIENLTDEEILRQCYIRNDDINKHNLELNTLFNDEAPKFDSRIIPLRNTTNTQQYLEGQITSQEQKTPDPIVIIGSKGSGKTTFIKYFTEVTLSEKIKNLRPILYVDFRSYTKQDVLDTEGIYRKITNQLYDQYPSLNLTKYNILKKVYSKEVKRNTEGKWQPYSDDPKVLNQKIGDFIDQATNHVKDHLAKLSEYLVHVCHKRLVIILDNADQLGIDSQKEVYLLGQSLKRNLQSLVVISLREGYYFQWKNRPPFDAYQSNVVHITAPFYRQVLQSRIQFVIDNWDFNQLRGATENKTFTFNPSLIGNFFDNLNKTLFEKSNSEILSFLEETSYPNIRIGLEKFNFFLISGHTKITDYMTADDFNIPIWEFVKSVALESKYYYHSGESIIKNLFYPTSNNRNHFTKIRILNYLYDLAETNSFHDFYLSFEELFATFELAGHSEEILKSEIEELLEFKMIETKSVISDIEETYEIDSNSEFKITQCGIYYTKNLVNSFHYLDLVLQDTPIYDPQSFNEIRDVFPISNKKGIRALSHRIETVESFTKYLKLQEQQDHIRNDSNYGIRALDMNIVDSIYTQRLRKDLKRIKPKAL